MRYCFLTKGELGKKLCAAIHANKDLSSIFESQEYEGSGGDSWWLFQGEGSIDPLQNNVKQVADKIW